MDISTTYFVVAVAGVVIAALAVTHLPILIARLLAR
jgi:hypothetical protein